MAAGVLILDPVSIGPAVQTAPVDFLLESGAPEKL
jgi:hypothetical protein